MDVSVEGIETRPLIGVESGGERPPPQAPERHRQLCRPGPAGIEPPGGPPAAVRQSSGHVEQLVAQSLPCRLQEHSGKAKLSGPGEQILGHLYQQEPDRVGLEAGAGSPALGFRWAPRWDDDRVNQEVTR